MSDQPSTALLNGLLIDAEDLLASSSKLAQLEVQQLKDTVRRIARALAVLVIVGLTLTQAAALGLTAATGLPSWAGFGIVGALLAVAGYTTRRRRVR